MDAPTAPANKCKGSKATSKRRVMNCVTPAQGDCYSSMQLVSQPDGHPPVTNLYANNLSMSTPPTPDVVSAVGNRSRCDDMAYTYYAQSFAPSVRNRQPPQNGCMPMCSATSPMQDVRVASALTRTPRFDIPCNTYSNWSYDQCYGYYTPDGCYTACQYSHVVDVEDFMNSEKRKEKSRDAARCRRSRETEIFTDLSAALPLSQEQVSQLDKASIIRLAITYLKVRDMIKLVPEMFSEEVDSKCLDVQHSENANESVFLKSIDGFLLVLSTEGDFVYVSENICDYLGMNQIDLLGQSIYDYSHLCDHDEIKGMLSIKDKERYDSEETKSFFLRLKCTLTSKGRSVNLKSASYKVINCTGHMLHSTEETKPLESNSNFQHCMVAIGQPIPHPSNIEAPLPHQTFFTKHSLDMKFTYADEKMLEFLGFESDDLIGKSIYEYHHATDMSVISTAYKSLFSKGQCETSRYRFLAKSGGYCWVLTQATLIYDKVQKPESVVCVNFIISGIECADEIYTAFQLESASSSLKKPATLCASAATQSTPPRPLEITTDAKVELDALEANFVPLTITPPASVPEDAVKDDSSAPETQLLQQPHQPLIVTAKLFAELSDDLQSRPKTATSKIFAPRTEEMNKGFLTFSDEEPGLTLLKEEPDDLTHLAPVAGDVVSLETHPFLTDMLDDFLLKDGGFCPLLPVEPQDPFMAYRDSSVPSPLLLSPNVLKSSECSLPSLHSPTDSLGDEDQMPTFMTFPMEEDPELVMKAPYISMTMNDDLPLLNSDDLMWSEGVHSVPVQFPCRKSYTGGGASSIDDNNSGGTGTPRSTSSLAELLSASVSKHTKEVILDRIEPCNNKNFTWNSNENKQQLSSNGTHGHNGVKRNAIPYDISSKRVKSEQKDIMSSELLQQLISNNTHNAAAQRAKNKTSWLMDTGGKKTACVSQPNDSVLMNLLNLPEQSLSPPLSPTEILNTSDLRRETFYLMKTSKTMKSPDLLPGQLQGALLQQQLQALQQKQLQLEQQQEMLDQRQMRKLPISLLDPDALGIPSLLDLTQQDYEVNAPVCTNLLQGDDLLFALNNDAVLADGVI